MGNYEPKEPTFYKYGDTLASGASHVIEASRCGCLQSDAICDAVLSESVVGVRKEYCNIIGSFDTNGARD